MLVALVTHGLRQLPWLLTWTQVLPRHSPTGMTSVTTTLFPANLLNLVLLRLLLISTQPLSSFFFIVPMIRVLRLEHNSRTESDTQFWWYLCFGSSGYIVWAYYFCGCSSFYQAAVFPIYVVSILGAIVHLILLLIATSLTFGVRDKRPIPLVLVPASSFFTAAVLWWVPELDWIGWLGFSLTALSHCFRLGATNYQDEFTFWLFDASIPIWLVNAIISAVGAVSGFLWLRHPQLCVSLEYKVTSYVIGVVRGVEVYLWCSRGITRVLSKIEGDQQ